MEGGKLGKYELRGTIGRGAIGVVYSGWDPVIERQVAIKTLPRLDIDDQESEKYPRFQREARAAGRLHHPNIVSTFDYGETEACAFIVMELLPGPSLQAAIKNQKRLSLPEINGIMQGLLAGLQHSHSRNVVHRDIKPANIVFAEDGEVKITDFGVAHLESSSLTVVGSQIGTPAYMAPEQVLGTSVDARSDLYSAGVVLFEMLAGRRPFEGSTSSIMHQIVSTQPPSPSVFAEKVSPCLDTLLGKALAKNPDDRYQTAADFASALRQAIAASEGERAHAPAPGGSDVDPTRMPGRNQLAEQPLAPALAASSTRPRSRLSGHRLLGPLTISFVVLAGVAASVLYYSVDRPVRGTAPSSSTPAPPGSEPSHASRARGSISGPPPIATIAPAMTPDQPASERPVPPPPVSPIQPASIGNAITSTLASAPCTLITDGVTEAGAVKLTGLTALGEASEMALQGLMLRAIGQVSPDTPVVWEIRRIEGPYCLALDVLRSIRSEAGSLARAMSVVLPDAHSRPMEGEPLEVRLTMPDFPASVLLDYFVNDGTVVHLATDPSRSAAAQAVVSSRAQTTSGSRITVGKPYGANLVTAIASSAPLMMAKRPDREPAAAYLNDLKSALEQAHDRGTRLAVDALMINTEPR
jgi:eukaryotic-like serine/threonine-protein kinase